MKVKEHYDTHLAGFYSWMIGDFATKSMEFQNFLIEQAIVPFSSKRVLDLGAGHGIQSVALARLGFFVKAVDFSNQLLNELEINAKGLPIELLNDDIKNVKQLADKETELIICCGDTLSHLSSKKEIQDLIADISTSLISGGKTILSFRDYSSELVGVNRFIPVKSDGDRILTCFLEYEDEIVKVTDLLYEQTEEGWKQKVSSYPKVRISTKEIVQYIEDAGLKILLNRDIKRMATIIAEK